MADDARPAGEPAPTRPAKGGRPTLLLIAAVTLAPIVASYSAYYFFPREPAANYGTLLATPPLAGIDGTRPDGSAFRLDDLRGRWVLVALGTGECASACEQRLYATRQARTMQGKEQERIVRVYLQDGDAPPAASLLAQHPGLLTARITAGVAAKFPGGTASLYLIDPLGNLVLRYPEDPDIKGIARDLTRLLKASRIG